MAWTSRSFEFAWLEGRADKPTTKVKFDSACPWYDKRGLTFARGCSVCPNGFHNDGCTYYVEKPIQNPIMPRVISAPVCKLEIEWRRPCLKIGHAKTFDIVLG